MELASLHKRKHETFAPKPEHAPKMGYKHSKVETDSYVMDLHNKRGHGTLQGESRNIELITES